MYIVRSPGTCGEFIQGSINGQSFLVTCPINRYSYAITDNSASKIRLTSYTRQLLAKSQQAYKKASSLCANQREISPIYWRSDIPQGKGMASSSADISAIAMATSLACHHRLSNKELETICLSIEPSDAAFYPGIIQFDYMQGRMAQPLGTCPPLKILIFDSGGMIDTIAFNRRKELPTLIKEKEPYIKEALTLFKKGLQAHDIGKIGEAATISAFANQRILYKPYLYRLHELGKTYGSLGTIIAHSGTVSGLIFPESDKANIAACKEEILAELVSLTYLDLVETRMEGLTYAKFNDDEEFEASKWQKIEQEVCR